FGRKSSEHFEYRPNENVSMCRIGSIDDPSSCRLNKRLFEEREVLIASGNECGLVQYALVALLKSDICHVPIGYGSEEIGQLIYHRVG
ncbi:hypothetical protein PFISCL1PPCAC_14066, partial [Pristionchus fissidentatus]